MSCVDGSQRVDYLFVPRRTNQTTIGRQVELRPCDIDSGGYAVRAANLPCKEVGRTLSGWAPAQVHGKNDPRQAVFIDDGWQCWARLEAEFGPILNVCMRDDQVIAYKVG